MSNHDFKLDISIPENITASILKHSIQQKSRKAEGNICGKQWRIRDLPDGEDQHFP